MTFFQYNNPTLVKQNNFESLYSTLMHRSSSSNIHPKNGRFEPFPLKKTPEKHRPLETTSEIPQEVIPGSTWTPLKEAACFGHLRCADDLLKTAEEAAEAFHKPHGIRLRKTGMYYCTYMFIWSICNMYLHLDDFLWYM